MSYLRQQARLTGTPPQSEPLNARQVENSAGGYSFPVDDWKRLERFLILGSEGGSYYATERKLTSENCDAVKRCIVADGERAVRTVVEISEAGRAPKNAPALFVLALAAAAEAPKTRAAALDALPRVARIGTHLFHFVDYVNELRGWGRGLKRAVAGWYLDRPIEKLALQLVKYQSRDGWSHRDVLRLAKPRTSTLQRNYSNAFRWAVGKGVDAFEPYLPPLIHAFESAKTCSTQELIRLIREYGLTREMVPTEALTKVDVWEALLEKMPLEALLRNLGNLSKVGVLKPLSTGAREVARRFTDAAAIRAARLHPIKILVGSRTYGSGRGLRGHGEWPVVPQVAEALDEAFYLAFAAVEPTNKRWYLALDVSGSMGGGSVAGTNLTPREASAAMAMVTARSEPNYYVAAFTCNGPAGTYGGMWDRSRTQMEPFSMTAWQTLNDVVTAVQRLRMGGTDCALPMLDALEKRLEVDCFVVYTDSETWAGRIHPKQALDQYRQRMGIPAKLIVVGMVSNGFSIADPLDGGMLDVVGFDTVAPAVMADFGR